MDPRSDAIFKALADESRRRILSALCREPLVAGDLAKLVGLRPNAVSFHLKELKAADLVSIRREGRFLRYHVNAVALSDWRESVEQVFGRPKPAEPPELPVSTKPGRPRERRLSTPVPSAPAAWDDALPTELL